MIEFCIDRSVRAFGSWNNLWSWFNVLVSNWERSTLTLENSLMAPIGSGSATISSKESRLARERLKLISTGVLLSESSTISSGQLPSDRARECCMEARADCSSLDLRRSSLLADSIWSALFTPLVAGLCSRTYSAGRIAVGRCLSMKSNSVASCFWQA